MKIAVCISGQPRSYQKGFEYLKKNLLDNWDCDIFIHSWNNNVYNNDDIISLYKPKEWKFETYPWSFNALNEKYTETPNAESFPPANAVYAFYSVFQSSLLYKKYIQDKKFDYNWIIKTRFDYALNLQIDFINLEKNKLYVPNCRMVPAKDFCNDQFAWGTPLIMVPYMSTYYYLDYFYKLGYEMNGEIMLQATLHQNGFVGNKLEYVDMNNPFPPGRYNGTTHSLIRDDMSLWKNQ